MSEKEVYNLIIGLTGPYGAGCSSLAEELSRIINDWPGCISKVIHAADLIQRYYLNFHEEIHIEENNSAQRRKALQKVGTDLRLNDPEFVGKIISASIYEEGFLIEDSLEINETNTIVFIIDSIKNSNDLKFLKKTYIDEQYLLFVHADREIRWRRMVDYKSWKDNQRVKFEERDQVDQDEKTLDPKVKDSGQQVAKLASQADYYVVNNQNREKLKQDGERFLEILFGDGKNQPTCHERFMHIAFSASNGSFCLSRQVGAAIVDREGNILSIGHNDVPKAFGGLYGYEDEVDRRCYLVGDRRCINDTNKEERFDDLSKKIIKKLELSDNKAADLEEIINKSSFKEVIEYCRAVHAEMDALLKIARKGYGSTTNAIMYVTTQPCHNCTKHIICAGIKKVFYFEPYPKSLGVELHSDSMKIGAEYTDSETHKVLFIPYEGIAPHRFHDFFTLIGERKNAKGTYLQRTKTEQSLYPRFSNKIFKRSRKKETLDPITSFESRNASEIANLIKENYDDI